MFILFNLKLLLLIIKLPFTIFIGRFRGLYLNQIPPKSVYAFILLLFIRQFKFIYLVTAKTLVTNLKSSTINYIKPHSISKIVLYLDKFMPFIIHFAPSAESLPRETKATNLPLLSKIGAPLVPIKLSFS